jgi:hypothetical protein
VLRAACHADAFTDSLANTFTDAYPDGFATTDPAAHADSFANQGSYANAHEGAHTDADQGSDADADANQGPDSDADEGTHANADADADQSSDPNAHSRRDCDSDEDAASTHRHSHGRSNSYAVANTLGFPIADADPHGLAKRNPARDARTHSNGDSDRGSCHPSTAHADTIDRANGVAVAHALALADANSWSSRRR